VPSDNVELFLRGVEAMARLDDSAIVETLHPDATFEPLRSATEGAFHGHDGMRRFLADTRDTFDVFEPHFTDVRDLDDGRVLAIGTIHVRGRASGADSEIPTACIATIRDGLVFHYKDFGDPRMALQEAGRNG
jgi:ketosteroid isomerase-like protein